MKKNGQIASLAVAHQSDKWGHHYYCDVYEHYFEQFKDEKMTITFFHLQEPISDEIIRSARAEAAGGPTLVLEDDVEFQPHFINFFDRYIDSLPAWDVLYLGANQVRPLQRGHGDVVGRVSRAFTTSSYAVTPHGARVLANTARAQPYLQIDVAFASVQANIACYAFLKPLAWQRAGYSDIQGGDVDYKKSMCPC